jgi:hypothetical protein
MVLNVKVSKKQLFFSFIFLIFILIIISIHNLGFDEPLASIVDDATETGTYFTLFTLFLQLLIWIFVAMVLLLIWGSMLEALTPRMTTTVINTLRVLGRMIIIPFCIIAYLNNFPAFQGTLLGISAILGTAIGFASTTTMSNFLSGLYIMATRPFLIGDYIILPDSKVEGRVKEITVNYTKITLPTGNIILVSNSKFLGQSIINTRTTEDHLIFKKDQEKQFAYPLMWGTNSDEKHAWAVEAIQKTGEEFNERLEKPVSWFVYSRTRLDTVYQVNLISNSATKLLDLTGDFMTALSKNYDEVKEKYS